MHPYEISTVMRERGFSFSIKPNFGSLHSVIAGLLVKSCIEAKATEKEGNHPERTVYAITPAGVAELYAQLRSPIGEPMKEYPRFMAGLAVLAHFQPAEARASRERRACTLAEELRKTGELHAKSIDSGVDALFLFEMDYAMTMLGAELGWARGLIAKIGDGKFAALDSGLLKWKIFQADESAKPGQVVERE
jgi:DNA-binding PadR family transcriptional regulator